jgi:hypothetical protein
VYSRIMDVGRRPHHFRHLQLSRLLDFATGRVGSALRGALGMREGGESVVRSTWKEVSYIYSLVKRGTG